ncbi:hypothetical protein N7532_009090 [Penicillium argentinense]|uniref:Ell binding protein Ebp1 C-terminal domain-containing protein n=1 Tax=Penicillium argentinense TaxID=1131581 RepID=A0A9W9K2N4_9EURO|nr:uncharacterized protein N7532_009090 [Penicillium argentinense]KAJ5090406.1 hypothetical protein N7532_009090 [Penicillium argentinense]
MSVNDQPPSADPTLSSQAYASDLEALDHRLKRLSETVLPLHPYLLTLPTNAPFRLGSRSANNNWAVGHDRPFSSEEQQLQYMTFLSHHSGDSLLVAVGDWSDDSGRMMTDQPTTTTATENPRDTIAKKKISLKDYNTQKVTNVVATPAENRARERREESKRERERTATSPRVTNSELARNGKLDTTPIPSKSQTRPSPNQDSQKRPSATLFESLDPQAAKGTEMHSPKKPRLSPEKEPRIESVPAKSRSPRLPALLSPTLPPTAAPKLPRLLSPTLPPDIEKELARLGGNSPTRTSPKRESTGARSKRDDVSHPRSLASAKDPSKPNPLQRIVSLKYGKSNRKRVEALLKFSAKKTLYRTNFSPGTETDYEEAPHSEKKRDDVDPVRNNIVSKKPKTKGRNETDETAGPVSGRVKGFKASSDKPSTPTFHPPTQDKIKQTSLTPVKDVKGMVSRRHDPGDGDGKTPVNPTNKRYSTELGAKGSPSQSESRCRNSDRRAWRDEFQRFSNIGRELKHAAERYTTTAGTSSTDEKLAAVTAIEAILCFVLAFVADDQSKALARQTGDSSTWISILAYWRVVRKRSQSYPVLHSLSLLLGAVSYDAIHALDLERLAASPLPGENTPVPTPGSDSHAVPADESKKGWEKFLELKNRLPECYKESQKLWLEGTRRLSEDILSQHFPTTWSRRSHNYAERGKLPLKAGEYVGDYFLPLGGTTPPIEIVRFGWSLLHEWCSQEGVEWNGRLIL